MVLTAPTHVAAKVLDHEKAITLARYCHKGGKPPTLLIVDKCFMVSSILWHAIYETWFRKPFRLIAVGDPAQFRAILEDIPDDKLLWSHFFKTICGHNLVRLSYPRRSDKRLVELYSSPPSLYELALKFPATGLGGPRDYRVCVTSRCRHAVNKFMQRRFSVGKATLVLPETPTSPERTLTIGSPVIANKTENGLFNGCRYTVESIDPLVISGEQASPLTLTLAQARAIDLAWATTYWKMQAFTCPKGAKVILLQTQHPHCCKRCLHVGMSRSQALDDLQFAPPKWSDLI